MNIIRDRIKYLEREQVIKSAYGYTIKDWKIYGYNEQPSFDHELEARISFRSRVRNI